MLAATELGLSEGEAARQVADYRAAVALERTTADLPETVLAAGI